MDFAPRHRTVVSESGIISTVLTSWHYLQGEGHKKNELTPRSRVKNTATERETEVTRQGTCETSHEGVWGSGYIDPHLS
jgi:hypothetical protein